MEGAPGTPSADGVTSVFTPSSRHLKPQQKTSSHHRVRSIGDWVKQAMSPSVKREQTDDAFTPQKVVEAVEHERVSRKLFNTSLVAAPNKAAPRRAGDAMIEFFALIACGRPDPVVEMTWPHQSDLKINFFGQFCLPFRSEEQMQARDDEFVFFISSENNAERLVCVCVVVGAKQTTTKKSSLHLDLVLSSRTTSGHRRSLSSGDAASTSLAVAGGPKCFVLVSKFPYVPCLLHVVRGLAAQERLEAGCSESMVRECVNRLLVPLPEIDETLLVTTPAGEPLLWRRTNEQNREEAMLGRWNLATSFSCLLENGELWQLLSAVMTERQILIAGSKLDRVSGIALLLMELIRPFEYQAVFLPILPPSLSDVLDAPVPFVAGMYCVAGSAPSVGSEKNASLVVYNCDSNKIFASQPMPKLPFESEIKKAIVALAKANAFDHAVNRINQYWEELFGDFRKHCFRDVSNPSEPVTIFVSEAFISEKSNSGGAEFFKLFFKTQLWSCHSDEKRTRFDLQRRDSLMSVRMMAARK